MVVRCLRLSRQEENALKTPLLISTTYGFNYMRKNGMYIVYLASRFLTGMAITTGWLISIWTVMNLRMAGLSWRVTCYSRMGAASGRLTLAKECVKEQLEATNPLCQIITLDGVAMSMCFGLAKVGAKLPISRNGCRNSTHHFNHIRKFPKCKFGRK